MSAAAFGLEPQVCERARLARDPRFDGRFFVGVRTTGIYCRPICPVPPPRARNVAFFPSAAAAAEAGFRPCLRCRPEASPGTPAWLGTSATVSRALRLIADGALDHDSQEALAARLGIGSRHLARLFRQHLGASPGAVARTRRLHFAKRLVDETDLPFTEVAAAAGYGSVRRFNEAFRSTYDRAPSQLRRRGRVLGEGAPEVSLRLGFRPPLHWQSLAAFFALRAMPEVERVDERGYARSFIVDGSPGVFRVSPVPGENTLRLQLRGGPASGWLPLVERVRRQFDLGAEPAEIEAVLARDPEMAPLVRARPGLRVPGAWCGFEMAVRAVLGQQVSVAGARTFAARLTERFGTGLPEALCEDGLSRLFPAAEALVDAPLEVLGLVRVRAAAIRALARAFAENTLTLDGSVGVEALVEQLSRIHGIGRWTAQVVALRALGEPDAFPDGDLGLARALADGEGRRLSASALRARAEPWRPWRAYGALHLWAADALQQASKSR